MIQYISDKRVRIWLVPSNKPSRPHSLSGLIQMFNKNCYELYNSYTQRSKAEEGDTR